MKGRFQGRDGGGLRHPLQEVKNTKNAVWMHYFTIHTFKNYWCSMPPDCRRSSCWLKTPSFPLSKTPGSAPVNSEPIVAFSVLLLIILADVSGNRNKTKRTHSKRHTLGLWLVNESTCNCCNYVWQQYKTIASWVSNCRVCVLLKSAAKVHARYPGNSCSNK